MSVPRPEDLPFLPAQGGVSATLFTCALCGARFTHGELVCGRCPMSNSCDIVQCPHCAYQFPRESRLVAWLRRLLRLRGGREGLQ